MARTAKLFMNGRSQAVRLPAEFRFKGKEVFIRRDKKTGEVILSDKPDWESFFALRDSIDVPNDFLKDIRDKRPPEDRDLF